MTVLSRLPRHAVDLLRAHGRQRTFSRGHVIYFQGDPAEAVYLIESGRVAIEVCDKRGRRVIVDLVGRDDCFGLGEVLRGGVPRRASARAVSDTQVLRIASGDVSELRRQMPELDRSLLEETLDRVDRLTDLLVDARRDDTFHRCLLRLVELVPANCDEQAEIHLTQADLSAWVGASRPAVNQVLQRLQQRGVLRLKRNRIVVTDVVALRGAAA